MDTLQVLKNISFFFLKKIQCLKLFRVLAYVLTPGESIPRHTEAEQCCQNTDMRKGQGQTFCKDISPKKLHWNMATKGLSADMCCLKLSFKSTLEVGKVQHINI